MQYAVFSMQYAKTQAKITAQDKPDFGWFQKLKIITNSARSATLEDTS